MTQTANSSTTSDGAALWETRFLSRRDLKFSRCADQQESWNAFDPITRQSVRVGLLEYLLLSRVDGQRTLDELASGFAREKIPVVMNHLADAANRLRAMGLLRTSQVLATTSTPVRTFQQIVSSFVVWQIRGLNPDLALRWLAPRCGWLFSRRAVAVWSLLIVATSAMVCFDFVRLTTQTATWQNMLSGNSGLALGGWLLAVFLITRGLHELGHAVVCHRQGIRCPDIGLLFIMCAPCVYCDVSESWRLPKRSQRAAVAAGGMYVELVIATIASWVWLATVDSPINALALQTMCVCSVSTVLVNANPLMRFDGYFILADWLDEVNLRSKADRLLSSKVSNWVLGSSVDSAVVANTGRNAILMLFSAAGWIYRSLLAIAVACGVALLWSNWNLTWVGRGVSCAILVSWWGIPLFGFVKLMSGEASRRGRRLRLALVTACVILAAALVPIPTRRIATGWIRPQMMQGIYASETATLIDCQIDDGATVVQGQPLFRFRNESIASSLVAATAAVRNARTQYASMRRSRDMYGYDIDLTPFATRSEALKKQAYATQRRYEDLTLTAVANGTIVAGQAGSPVELADTTAGVAPPQASATTTWCDTEQLGRSVPAGTLLASIRGDDYLAVVPLSADQLRDVSMATHCRLRLSDAQRTVIAGEVHNVVRLQHGNTLRSWPAQSSLASPEPERRSSTSGASYAAIVLLPPNTNGERFCDEAVDVVFHTDTTSLYNLARTWLHANLRFLSQ